MDCRTQKECHRQDNFLFLMRFSSTFKIFADFSLVIRHHSILPNKIKHEFGNSLGLFI